MLNAASLQAEDAAAVTCPTCRAAVDTRNPVHPDRLTEATLGVIMAAHPDPEWAERKE